MDNFVIKKEDIFNRAIEVKNAYTCGIYFLLRDKKIVYVGQTSCGLSRMHMHLNYKDFDSFSFFPCNKKDLDNIESDNIFKYKPEYNKKISGKYGYDRKQNVFYIKPLMKEKKDRKDYNRDNLTNKKKSAVIVQTGETFDSLDKLAKKLNVTPSAISHAINRNCRCKGFTIKIIGDK